MTVNGFYLISDFHIDINKLHDPKHVDGAILHTPKAARVVKQIYNWLGIPKGRIVVFNGDTSNSAEVTEKVWAEAGQKFRVLGVPGNHEYYFPRMRPVSEVDKRLEAIEVAYPSVTVLGPGKRFIDGKTLYLGCCGWYNWDAIPELDRHEEREMWIGGSNDAIFPQYDCGYPDALAFKQAEWLSDEIVRVQTEDEIESVVILTHTVPRVEFLVGPDHKWYKMNGSYANTFMTDVPKLDLKKKIKVWAYGHTHFHGDTVVDGIRYVCNARGYAGEATSLGAYWKPKWIGLDR